MMKSSNRHFGHIQAYFFGLIQHARGDVLLAAVWAGAGAGGHLGGGPRIRSSPDGQDEAVNTPTTLLPVLEV